MQLPHALQVIPVIDLAGGRVVHAVRGERAAYRPVRSRLVQGSEPIAVAHALLASTATPERPVLYVADLDALQGRPAQSAVMAALLGMHPGLELWLDAGFASPAQARELVAGLGPGRARARPVFGTESLADAGALDALARDPHAILSLDARQGRPLDPAGVFDAPQRWPATLIVMCLDRVGAGQGPDIEAFARLRARAPGRRWIGAGGVRSPADLDDAAAAGATGWLVASALHDGSLGVPRPYRAPDAARGKAS